jgi:hypothetical protein
VHAVGEHVVDEVAERRGLGRGGHAGDEEQAEHGQQGEDTTDRHVLDVPAGGPSSRPGAPSFEVGG